MWPANAHIRNLLLVPTHAQYLRTLTILTTMGCVIQYYTYISRYVLSLLHVHRIIVTILCQLKICF